QRGHRQLAACLQPLVVVAAPVNGANRQAVLIDQHQSATTDIVGGESIDIVLSGPQGGFAGIEQQQFISRQIVVATRADFAIEGIQYDQTVAGDAGGAV